MARERVHNPEITAVYLREYSIPSNVTYTPWQKFGPFFSSPTSSTPTYISRWPLPSQWLKTCFQIKAEDLGILNPAHFLCLWNCTVLPEWMCFPVERRRPLQSQERKSEKEKEHSTCILQLQEEPNFASEMTNAKTSESNKHRLNPTIPYTFQMAVLLFIFKSTIWTFIHLFVTLFYFFEVFFFNVVGVVS